MKNYFKRPNIPLNINLFCSRCTTCLTFNQNDYTGCILVQLENWRKVRCLSLWRRNEIPMGIAYGSLHLPLTHIILASHFLGHRQTVQTQIRRRRTGRPHHYGHLLQIQKESLQLLTLCTSFHDLINVHSRRSGADNPRGQNFDVNRNLLSLRSFATSFKKISLKSDFIHFFFMILYMYIAPGQGQTAPRGQSFDVNRNVLSLYPFVASFKDISLKSDFIQFFSWFNTCM